jgi:type IV pilus assembly protein PilP
LTKNPDAKSIFTSWILLGLIASVFLLSACDNQGKLRDLREYIAKLDKTTLLNQPKKDIIASIHVPMPVLYQSATLRDPFEESTISYTEKGMINPVNAFPLNMLRYAGMIAVGSKRWAVILVPDGRVYQLTLGDPIGDHDGKITKINTDHVEVMEKMTDDTKHISSRLVILQLKDGV